MNSPVQYVPLRVRSNRSLLSGASTTGALLEKAADCGIRALALTDENNLYGAVSFFEKAREAGTRPVLGAIVNDGSGAQAVLLVRNRAGYSSLCHILSRRHLEEGFELARALAECQEGLFILVPDAGLAERLAGVLDPGRLRLEMVRPARSVNAERRLLKTSRRLCLPLAASCDVYFTEPADFELHVALQAMSENMLLDEVRQGLARRRECFFRTPDEMARLFADIPEAVAETVRVAEQCDFDLLGLEPVFPKVAGDSFERLWGETFAGVRSRYAEPGGEVMGRLRREMDLITRLGFADYFLVVADIVRHARSLGTPVAGRGSGASSLVAYCLGITNVDPLRYKLPFERFLNEGRQDFPDLDIDFCWRMRDDVIDYVYRTYGDDHVAMIATYATMQPRLAFRESAKVLGLSDTVITKVAGKLRSGLPREKWGTLPAEPEAVERALELAKQLGGFPHHLSVHCGGVVITPDHIAGHAPIQRAEKGVVVTQYDKNGVETVGLVKLDLLGNRALSSAGEAVRLVHEGRGEAIDPERLPDGDRATVRVLVSGDTVGVNQLESPAMRHLLCQMRPRNTRDLMQVLALIRPGAAGLGMKEAFVRRARRMDPVPPLDPRLDGILDDTYGIMLYEDDALMIASALAGLPPQRADRFRRAVTKCRTDEDRIRISREFLRLCRKNGVARELAEDLWVQMSKFNSYSFCRAHAASYARLAWANAYLKAHHPAEFWTAALNNNQGMYPRWVCVEEAKRRGVPVRLPCVNRSGEEFTLEGGAIRVGLNQIAGISVRAIESIVAGRSFESLGDLIARSKVKIAEAENLIRAGALDFAGRTRPEMLLELHTSFDEAKRLRGRMELVRFVPGPAAGEADLVDYTEAKKLADEWELMEFSCRRHPLAAVRPVLDRLGVVRSCDLPDRAGRRVTIAGVAAAGRRTRTESGKVMGFLTLSDEWGLAEVTLFSDVYNRHRLILTNAGLGPFVAEGVVESQHDAVSVTAARIRTLRAYLARKGSHRRPRPPTYAVRR